jgi:predicted permease
MVSTTHDLRIAFRGLFKDSRSTVAAVATLALGIGASTAIFSVVYGVLLRPLPYPEPERIVAAKQVFEEGKQGNFSDPNFEDVHDRNRSLAFLAQYADRIVSVSGASEPVRVRGAWVSREFFDVLGVEPVVGRRFVEEELSIGGAPAVLVSYGFWQRRLGASRELSSQRLSFDGRTHAVVGVLPPGFSFPPETEVWTPRELEPRYESRTAHNWKAIGRLGPDVSLEKAREDVSAIARELRAAHGENTWMIDAALVPLHQELVGRVETALVVLLSAVGFLLLVASANVVNLLLARAQSREREVAVRAALGASRSDLVRLFLAESVLLALAGGSFGVLLARWGVPLLLALEPGDLPRVSEIGVSLEVLSFALGLSILVSFILGLVTALRSTRSGASLMDRSRAGRVASARFRSALVVAQVAITLVLLVGGGLLARSLFSLLDVDAGFRRSRALVVDLDHPPPSSDSEKAELGRREEELLARVRTLPGVRRAGFVDRLPLATGLRNGMFLLVEPGDQLASFDDFRRLAADPARVGMAEYSAASDGYFETMRIPLVAGRLFDERDAPNATHVALLSASLVREKWPSDDPSSVLGRLIQFGNMDGDLRLLHVIGVVGDVRHAGLELDARPTIYVSARQRPPSGYSIVVELEGAVAPLVESTRSAVSELAPDVPPRFREIEEVFSSSVADRRFNLVLLAAFGFFALALAVIGIYGVVSRGVTERTRELGLRMALGARPRDVRSLVVAQGSWFIGIGIVLGLALGFGLTRLLSSLLFGVSATDPLTFFGLALFLAGVGLLACYLPARRASQVDPMTCLRYE